jgi:hypothetical protein
MSTQLLAELSGVLTQLYGPILHRQFNRRGVLAGLLPKSVGRGGQCLWPVSFSGTTAGAYPEGAPVVETDLTHDIEESASIPWGQYRGSFGISGLTAAAVMSADGSSDELLNLIDKHIHDKGTKLTQAINRALYAGDGSGRTLVGLTAALANTGIYAGIDRATRPEWQGNVIANGGTPRPLEKRHLDDLESAIYDACGIPPDVIVCSTATAKAYESLFEPISRVIIDQNAGADLSPVRSAIGSPIIPANAGFTGLSYRGLPVYRDRDCPAGNLFMLNREYLELRTLAQPARTTSTNVADASLKGADEGNDVGISARVEALAKVGDSDRFSVKVYPQLVCTRPNFHGTLMDIQE